MTLTYVNRIDGTPRLLNEKPRCLQKYLESDKLIINTILRKCSNESQTLLFNHFPRKLFKTTNETSLKIKLQKSALLFLL